MNFNPALFEAFQTKLKVGNRRSIHLNAIPGNSRYKFDLARLTTISKSLPEHFIIDLLTLRTVNFKFSIHNTPIKPKEGAYDEDHVYLNGNFNFKKETIEKKDNDNSDKVEIERLSNLQKLATSIENLIFQNEVVLSEKGLNSLGFGFPLLIRRDMNDGQISVAPLLIWSIKIKPSSEMNTWEISRCEEDPIYLNEVLINHLQSDSGVFLEPIPSEMLEDGKIDKPELLAICQSILSQLKVEQNLDFILNNYEAILPIKTKASYEKMLPQKGDAFIEKCGIFSLFEVQKQSIINDYSELITNYKPLEIENNTNSFQSITTVETDPSQQGILESLKTQKKILIQGPPGTGKSQTLTALLINALENKQKTIVVCEKQTALEVLQSALQKHKLDRFSMMIKDSIADRKQVVDAIRNIIDDSNFKNTISIYPESILQEQINSIQTLKNQINAVHHKLNDTLLNDLTWTDIIGQLLQYLPQKESIKLHDIPFVFSSEEWNSCNEIIEKGYPLYQAFEPLKDRLLYNPDQITKVDVFTSQRQANEIFYDYKNQWKKIMMLFEQFSGFYYKKRKEEFTNQLSEITHCIHEVAVLSSTLDEQSDEFNNEKTEGLFYKISAWFSTSKKNVLKNKLQLQELVKKIKKISLHSNFYPITISADLWRNVQEVKKYEERIALAKQTFNDKVATDFKNIDFFHCFELDYQSKELESLVTESKKLQQKIQTDHWVYNWQNSITFQDFKLQWEEVSRQHDVFTSDISNPFLITYNWFFFYQSLTTIQRQVLEKLLTKTCWKASFGYAYLDLVLQRNANHTLNFNETHYENLQKKISNFSSSQMNFIESYWKSEQQKAVTHFEKTNKEITVANLYNKRKSVKFNRLTLRQIVNKDTDLFTAFFPIIFTTPDVCSNLFQGKNFYFDNVVFDEASQLKLEDNLPALLKGKNVIIAGDEHQMPPSNYFSKVFDGTYEDEDDLEEDTLISQKNALLSIESLLDFALEYQFDKNHLDFHYRSKHPFLIDFSNHAFYNSRLKPLPALSLQKPIEFHQINGIFHEHINIEEAKKIIEILEQIEPDSSGKYPSVGIATFNITQRNYIKRLISYKRSLEGNNLFREKLIQLESSGLFIKNLENIQGDERDIIIVSSTYGPKKDGKFIQSFGPINHSKGYKLLNVIITRAKQKIHICNSVPFEIFSKYRTALDQEGSNNRKAVFYAYLAYCKAVNDENEEIRNEILEDLKKFSSRKDDKEAKEKNSFKEHVYNQLKKAIPEVEIFKNYHFGGFEIDFLMKQKSGKSIVVECLSKENYKTDLAYLEDLHKERIIKKSGYRYERIWSQFWWQNQEAEIQKWKKLITEN